MAYDQEKLTKFQKTILNQAEAQIDKIEKEISLYEKTELDKARQLAYDSAFEIMQQHIKDIGWKYKRELTRSALKSKQNYLTFRNELIEKLFLECEQKIIEFSSSDEYKDYLLKQAKVASSSFDSNGGNILLREMDMKYFEDLKTVLPIKKASIDKTNTLGGFKIVNTKTGLMLDFTIDTKLQKQRHLFYETSGFSISELEED